MALYYKMRQMLLQNATTVYYKIREKFIKKCVRFFIKKCDDFITNCDSTYGFALGTVVMSGLVLFNVTWVCWIIYRNVYVELLV